MRKICGQALDHVLTGAEEILLLLETTTDFAERESLMEAFELAEMYMKKHPRLNYNGRSSRGTVTAMQRLMLLRCEKPFFPRKDFEFPPFREEKTTVMI